MKHKFNIQHSSFIIAAIAVLALAMVACNKQQTCRCTVLGTQNVRVIKINKGECEQLKTYTYHNVMDSIKVDSLLCTGYEFRIDSIFE